MKQMKLKDTVDLMLSDRYEERLVGEYAQSIIRISKLETFLVKFCKNELKTKLKGNPDNLFLQYNAMIYYVMKLQERINDEGIDIARFIKEFELPVVCEAENRKIIEKHLTDDRRTHIWEHIAI